ncbi:MAG: LysR substrate-binding domain-containing protein [Pseudomonadota bacterium]|nr:LysR substrate-binding domain-containing protein [Pseudomonadota bacterium]
MISNSIGTDLLRLFVAVARQGSLSRAAMQDGRTQSAVSMQIRRLETLTGRRLFQRTGRGVVPTADGELLLGYATRILTLEDEALARLRRSAVSGTVRIGLAEEIANATLSGALGRLYRTYPDIQLDIVVEHSVALGQQWRDRTLDLLISPSSVVQGDARSVWNIDLQWVAAAEFRIDPDRPLDIVAFTAPCMWRQRMIDALTGMGREYRVTLTSQSVSALQAAVESGLGIGLLPPEALRTPMMRVLRAENGVPEPLTVQYGLYAQDRRRVEVDAALTVLEEILPASV